MLKIPNLRDATNSPKASRKDASLLGAPTPPSIGKAASKKPGKLQPTQQEQMDTIRRKAWVALAKKDISRAHKARAQAQRERVTVSKRLANQCVKAVKSRIISSQKSLKEANSRSGQ